MRYAVFLFACCFIATAELPVKMSVGFSRHLREWDGFGADYVGTKNPDEFLALNVRNVPRTASIRVAGTAAPSFAAFRSSANENYASAGVVPVTDGAISYPAPARSATTFFAAR